MVGNYNSHYNREYFTAAFWPVFVFHVSEGFKVVLSVCFIIVFYHMHSL